MNDQDSRAGGSMASCPRCKSTHAKGSALCPSCVGAPLTRSEIHSINAGVTLDQRNFEVEALQARAKAARRTPFPAFIAPDIAPLADAQAAPLPVTAPGVTPSGDLLGRTLGSYRVVRLLGAGGMGSVYLGEHPGIGSQVAIKVLHPRYASDPAIVERFFNEARAVNLIGHENIVKILDFNVSDDGCQYYVMEFLDGTSLGSATESAAPCPLELAGPILLQCCAALQAAHDHGIVHRDLKPDNIFLVRHLGRANVVKLVDFGIAKLSDAFVSHTQNGMVMGTPAYMSPEQADGDSHAVDARSDVYSLGVVMFQLATGRLPFGGAGVPMRQTIIGHLQTPPPRPRSINPSIPARWEAIILQTLAKKPADRFRSMSDLRKSLEACLRELGMSTELPRAEDVVDVRSPLPSSPLQSSPRATQPGPGARHQVSAGVRAIPTSVSSRGKSLPGQARRTPAMLIGGLAAVGAAALLGLCLFGHGGAEKAPPSAGPKDLVARPAAPAPLPPPARPPPLAQEASIPIAAPDPVPTPMPPGETTAFEPPTFPKKHTSPKRELAKAWGKISAEAKSRAEQTVAPTSDAPANAAPENAIIKSADGYLDTHTNLTWQPVLSGVAIDHDVAESSCSAMRNGRWRLPTVAEIRALALSALAEKQALPFGNGQRVWASSVLAYHSWLVELSSGKSSLASKSELYRAVCVRDP